MADAGAAAECPEGHADTVRLISLFAASRNGTVPAPAMTAAGGGGGGGGGCCGGACGCG